MIRLVAFVIAIVLAAMGLSWLADRPGTLVVNWQSLEIETSVFRAVILLATLMAASVIGWALVRHLWRSPASVGHFFSRRRQQRGLDALSSGLIAIGAGDKALAQRFAQQARKSLPNEPLTHLLRAQSAQLSGDRGTSRRIFEAMLGAPDTEQLGLRGLFLEAERERETEASRQFAARALALNPRLVWASDALFDLQCRAGDWEGALETLASARRNNLVDKNAAERRRAVLLTAQAQALEENEAEKALALAQEAHKLAVDLVPAAAIAGRILASRGNTAKVAKVVEATWRRQPHPDLATVYAHSRPGDSPRDRLERVRRLERMTPGNIEGPIALATAAMDARDWDAARMALERLDPEKTTQRVCTLMARIEGEHSNNAGRVREWLARAVHAPRDAAWTADGYVSETWAPISPVTGALDAFQWRVPGTPLQKQDAELITRRHEELIALGNASAAPREEVSDHAADEPLAEPARGRVREAGRGGSAAPAETPMREAPAARAVVVVPAVEVVTSDKSRDGGTRESATGEAPRTATVVTVPANERPAKPRPAAEDAEITVWRR